MWNELAVTGDKLVYKRNPAIVTELLASECNRAFTVTVDRPLQEM